MTDSEFIEHIACPHCGSSDANAVYSDGHTFCFSCKTTTRNDDKNLYMNDVQLKGIPTRLGKRQISQQTCEFYKVYKDGDTLRFPYYSSGGKIQGFKVKNKQKEFYYEGNPTDTLFGQNLFKDKGKRIVLCEGELDALSLYEAMPGWAACSISHGCAGAKKDIQKQIPYLQGYEEIVLFFDNDSHGKEATEEVASILPPGKVKIALLDTKYKDASDALQANDAQAVRKAIWNAKTYTPDGIVSGKELKKIVTTPTKPCDHEYPWKGLQEMSGGVEYGTLVCITAGTGIGKSSWSKQLCAHFLDKKERVGYLALEESNKQTGLGLMSTALGKAFHIGEHDRKDLEKAYDKTIANWNLFLFDGFGSYEADIIYNRIEYLACGLECRIIFLDHLSILLSGQVLDNEQKAISIVMTKLRSLVERTGITLFLVSHLRRTMSDTNHEEGARVTLGQLKGSSTISQISDQVFALERNQQAEGEFESSTTLRVLKNRRTGRTGVATTLNFDPEKCRYIENADF